MEKHPLHLKNPELQTSPEVQRAVEREEQKTGEKVPNDPAERIEAYTDRLENIFLNPDVHTRERNMEMFRDKIYDALIIKRENFPDSYFELQKRIARERGQAVEEIPENVREQMMDVAIEDQRVSLDAWMDYLSSEDAVYPAWFKYFVWRNVTKLSQFDKERGEFKKRTDSTVAPYPDIYREPLAQIADIYEKVKEDNKTLKEPEVRDAFSKKFPNLYAELISKSLAASIENREEIEGEWIKYEQGRDGDAEKLFQSLEGKGTGWCTAGASTAQTQIERGDFYVYYTNDSSGVPTQPRLAIRMDGDKRIGEVRGILPHQGVEPIMQEALDSKLSEFGGEADAYRKKSEGMRMLTALDHKREKGELFTKDDLVFLYEINGTIEGFGYEKDPRIAELREGRNSEEDMLVIFECTRDGIAHVPSQINENTKAYVGQLEPGIFKRLPENIEYVYTSFPDRRVRREKVEIGGKSAEQLISEMKEVGIDISDHAKTMLQNSEEFIPTKNRETMVLVFLTEADLGFKKTKETIKMERREIVERAQILGLELCPSDAGPSYLLKNQNLPLRNWFHIVMEPIYYGYVNKKDRSRVKDEFHLGRTESGLKLLTPYTRPGGVWNEKDRLVFRLPLSTSLGTGKSES